MEASQLMQLTYSAGPIVLSMAVVAELQNRRITGLLNCRIEDADRKQEGRRTTKAHR